MTILADHDTVADRDAWADHDPGVRKARSVPVMDIDGDRFQVVDLAGEVFLLDEKTGVSYQLGIHGRRIWHLLRAGASVEEAASMLAEETGGDPSVVLEDAHRLVADLIDVGVIVEVRV